MSGEAQLRDKLRKIEALFARAGTHGERIAAEAALALCRRYGLSPYRLYRQRPTTVMLRVPKRFVDEVLWPEFNELNAALMQYLNEVTTRVIREGVHGDTSEAAALPGR